MPKAGGAYVGYIEFKCSFKQKSKGRDEYSHDKTFNSFTEETQNRILEKVEEELKRLELNKTQVITQRVALIIEYTREEYENSKQKE